MRAFNKILVPVDFSKHADAAIATAIELGSRYESSIALMNVLEPVAFASPEDASFYAATITADMMADVRKALEKKRDDALAKGAKRVTVEQGCGNAATEITELANSYNYDLIVMGTLGRTGLAHFFLGSVAERVVRSASCPVLTVHEPCKSFTKILVPTDFSTGAEAALDAAIDLATRWQASITLVNVFQPFEHTYPTVTGIYSSVPIDHVLKDQLEALDRLRKRALTKGAKQVELAQRTGHPAKEICDLAREGGFDLIAMGTHGRSGLSRLLIGAIAERVVRTAPCPVLTLREPQK